ncbi:MAG: ATP-binding protein [Bacilli bacterium]|nr:ATP-binding protein [Bacilli bacterium]
MIDRTIYKQVINTIKNKAVTVITGARQVGKTTLCDKIEKELHFNYVSFANPLIRQSAKDDPQGFLLLHKAPLIIDEIQKVPEIFEYIEEIVDENIKQGKDKSLYVLTSSQSYQLMKGVTESMSGRAGLINMEPLSLSEINGVDEIPFSINLGKIIKRTNTYKLDVNDLYSYIVRGFYPELYKNPDLDSNTFYADYVATYLERDVSDLINLKDKTKFLNLMTVLASLTGQELIIENLAREIGVDKKTIESWISVLVAGNIIHLLNPYNEYSVTKTVIKRNKIYFSDTGLACYLARVNSKDTLINSYLKGPMTETYIINEIIKSYKNNNDKSAAFYFYRTYDKKEIDLVILRNGEISLLECKSGTNFNKSDISAFNFAKDSKYKNVINAIISTTDKIYSLDNNCYVLPVTSI